MIKAVRYHEGATIEGVKVRSLMIAPDESDDILSVHTYRGYERVEVGDFIVTDGNEVALVKRKLYEALRKASRATGKGGE